MQKLSDKMLRLIKVTDTVTKRFNSFKVIKAVVVLR